MVERCLPQKAVSPRPEARLPRRKNARVRPGRKPDLSGYQRRWAVERTFAWLGGFRRLLVGWETRAHIYLAFLLLTCSLIPLKAISG